MSKKHKYKAVYAGRRLIGSKVRQLFIRTDNKEEMYFTGIRLVYIGNTYECGASSISTRPIRVDVECIDNPEWDAAEMLVRAELKRRNDDYKLSKLSSKSIKIAKDALRPLCKGLGYNERRILIEMLTEVLNEK